METKEVVEISAEAGPDIKKLEANERQTGDVEDRMKGGCVRGYIIDLYNNTEMCGSDANLGKMAMVVGISQDKNATYFLLTTLIL